MVPDARSSALSRRAAAGYLRELLTRPGPYRRYWEQHVVRARQGEITQLAVAKVLARWLWSYPRLPGDADVLPRQLKDTVSRALSGRLLSRSTLTLFVEAFGFSEQEAARLWRLWAGSDAISVLSGARALPQGTEQDLRAVLGPRRHQTLSLHDHMRIAADGRPARTRTLQVIEAIADDVDSIPYIYDTNALTLEVGQGCLGVSGRLEQVGEDMFATHILLVGTLARGETSTLEYWTTYHYPGNPLDPAEREYRRAVMRRLQNLDMRVEFHPDRLPGHLWWSSWDRVGGDITTQQEVSLDSQHAAQRYVRLIEKSVVGFHWVW